MTAYSSIFERFPYNKNIKVVNGTAVRDMMEYVGVVRPAQWARMLGEDGLNYVSKTLLANAQDNTSKFGGTGELSKSLVLRRGGLTGYLREVASGFGIGTGARVSGLTEVKNYRGMANVTLGITHRKTDWGWKTPEDTYNYGRILDQGGWVHAKNHMLTVPLPANRIGSRKKHDMWYYQGRKETFTRPSKQNPEEKIVFKREIYYEDRWVESPGKKGEMELTSRRVYDITPIFVLKKSHYVAPTHWARDAMLETARGTQQWLVTHRPPFNPRSRL